MVQLLIEKGARVGQRNHRKESPADVVSGAWNAGLERFYGFIAASADVRLDLDSIREERPRMARRLVELAAKPAKDPNPSRRDTASRP
jgi:hypothetical protein